MNRVIDLIKQRRSLRSFSPTPLERHKLELLLEAGCYAPSGHNKQSWRFTAILNQTVLEELNEIIRDGFLSLTPGEHDPAELHDAKRKVESQGDRYCFYYHAPCLIIASNGKDSHNGTADCACALENMFLTAYDMQLGACWVNQLHWQSENPKLRTYLEALGIPADHMICGSGVFGTPNGSIPVASPRKENTWAIIE